MLNKFIRPLVIKQEQGNLFKTNIILLFIQQRTNWIYVFIPKFERAQWAYIWEESEMSQPLKFLLINMSK